MYRPDLFKETHNHQGLLYTPTGRLRALRDVLEGRKGRGKGRGWRRAMSSDTLDRDELQILRITMGNTGTLKKTDERQR